MFSRENRDHGQATVRLIWAEREWARFIETKEVRPRRYVRSRSTYPTLIDQSAQHLQEIQTLEGRTREPVGSHGSWPRASWRFCSTKSCCNDCQLLQLWLRETKYNSGCHSTRQRAEKLMCPHDVDSSTTQVMESWLTSLRFQRLFLN